MKLRKFGGSQPKDLWSIEVRLLLEEYLKLNFINDFSQYRTGKTRLQSSNLKQGQLNIEEYMARFSSLLCFDPHVASDDEAMADKFINGLNPDVFTLVNTGRPNNFDDALNRAKGAEAGLIRQKGALYVAQT